MAQGLASANRTGRKVRSEWERPSDWLAMPSFSPGEQKYAVLVAIFPGNNYIRFTPAGCAYTVNWGDGTSENLAVGVACERNIAWANVSGSTLTSEGFRQVIITMVPQSGNFSGFSASVRHSSLSGTQNCTTLDFEWQADAAALPLIGAGSSSQLHPLLRHVRCHGSIISSTAANAFSDTTSLHAIDIPVAFRPTSLSSFCLSSGIVEAPEMDTSLCTLAASAFQNCNRLRAAPSYDFSVCTGTNSMFSNCAALREVGSINMPVNTTTVSMFSGCGALTTIGTITTSSSLIATTSMFASCFSLVSAPMFNMSGVTNVVSMFAGCVALTTVPAYNWAAVQLATLCFQTCAVLSTVPALTYTAITNAQQMFTGSGITTFTEMGFTSATNVASMFASCTRLTSVNTSFPVATTAASICTSCSVLSSVTLALSTSCLTFTTAFSIAAPAVLKIVNVTGLGGVTTATNLFQNLTSLDTCTLTGLKITFTIQGNQLNAAALDALYTSLGTAVTQTITVTGNPGTTGDTPSIATGKGWTVTGS